MKWALALSFLSGFQALSYEILWYRAYSFATATQASTFGLLLGAYLTGLAVGAAWVGGLCARADAAGPEKARRVLAAVIAVTNLGAYLVIPALGWMLAAGWSVGYAFPLVGVAAAGLGTVFPLLCHLSVPADARAGARLSYLYLANILGSTAGSLFTGFVLLHVLPIRWIVPGLFGLGLAMASGVILLEGCARAKKAVAALALAGVAGWAAAPPLFDGLFERLQLKTPPQADARFAHVLENRNGVVTVDRQGIVYGGDIYDGVFNVSLRNPINTLTRPLFLEAVRPRARDVLVIGLSSGSWTLVTADLPGVERVTVVEINPGYLSLIPLYPQSARVLNHPKVKIVIDDARRWMVRNADARFDAIVANATYHWRAGATNLLSAEFLELARARLKPGGVYFYNTTGSPRVQRTGALAFPHALRVMGFLMVSDAPLEPDLAAWKRTLAGKTLDGKPEFDLSLEEDRLRLDMMVQEISNGLETRESILARTKKHLPITDDNLGTEFER